LPLQLLWINIVTDGLPALALSAEIPERDLMDRAPRPPREAVVSARRGLVLFALGLLVASVTALGFALVYRGEPANVQAARTTAFCVMTFSQLTLAFAFRSERRTLPELGLRSNPQLLFAIVASSALQLLPLAFASSRRLFRTTVPSAREWGILVALSLVPVTAVELLKIARRIVRKKDAPSSLP
jgi:Ca2+-transporting ATPase